jgi:hypothetical protein
MREAVAYEDATETSFRRISQSNRDLIPFKYDKGVQMSFYLWQRNPIARRLIDIPKDFCTGDDFSVAVKIKKRNPTGPDTDTGKLDAQKIWDDCAADPDNRLESDMAIFAQDLLLNGELIVPAFVRSQAAEDGSISGDGAVKFGYMDPINVKQTITDPKNIRTIKQLKMSGQNSTDEIVLNVIGVDNDPNSLTYGKRMGDAFYWRINYIANQTRGHGELLELADWLDSLDQFTFDAIEGVRLRNNFFYTKEMIGATPEDIKKEAVNTTTPRNASVKVHNEKVKYDVVTPDLKATDVERALLAFEGFIVGAKGYPMTWFGTGQDSNRASAAEMAIPTMRMLKATQKVIRLIVKDMVLFATDQAQIARTLTLGEDEYVDVEVSLFDFERKDTALIAAGLQQTVTALIAASEKNWVSDDTAKKVVDMQLERMGIEVSPDETVDEITKDNAENDATDPYKNVPPAAGVIGMKAPAVPAVVPVPVKK